MLMQQRDYVVGFICVPRHLPEQAEQARDDSRAVWLKVYKLIKPNDSLKLRLE